MQIELVPPEVLETEVVLVIKGEAAKHLAEESRKLVLRPQELMQIVAEKVIGRKLLSVIYTPVGRNRQETSFLRKLLAHRDYLTERDIKNRRRILNLRVNLARALQSEAVLKRDRDQRGGSVTVVSREAMKKYAAAAADRKMTPDALITMIVDIVANDDMIAAVIDA